MTVRRVNIIFLPLLLYISSFAFSQQRMKGKVFSKKDNVPISFASVIVNTRNIGTVTDTSGVFNFWFPRQVKQKDSVTISAVGYREIKVSLQDVISKKEFRLEEYERQLENVIVISTLKGDYRKFAYYRSWNEKGTGGEIGQVIELPKKNMKLKAVDVKINQNYDTCWLKLHLRSVGGMLPEEELLKDEIIVPATVKYGLMEFDLSEKDIKLSRRMVFVGFEVLKCSTPRSDIPSFFFMGSEEGENLFRDTPKANWNSGSRYTIYIRLLLE